MYIVDNYEKVDEAYDLFADAEDELRKENFKKAEQLKNKFSKIYDKLSWNDRSIVEQRLQQDGL